MSRVVKIKLLPQYHTVVRGKGRKGYIYGRCGAVIVSVTTIKIISATITDNQRNKFGRMRAGKFMLGRTVFDIIELDCCNH